MKNSSKKLRFLTFNHHEAYLCSLAETGYEFDVVIRYKDFDLKWHQNQKTCPSNFNLIEFDERAKKRLLSGYYDAVICHTLKNLLWLFRYRGVRFVFVAHIPLFQYSTLLKIKSLFKKIAFTLFRLTHQVTFFAVSEFKRESWREPGIVAPLSPNRIEPPKSGQGYGQIVMVCNNLYERQKELGYEWIEKLRSEFPIKIIGRNPGIAHNIEPRSYDDFKMHFGSGRIYIYTISQPYGDGYNTAMLEAMQMGLAVVTVENPSSPIIHEKNGLVGKDFDALRDCLHLLLNNNELIDRLGKEAQQTIEQMFSKRQFLSAWEKILKRGDHDKNRVSTSPERFEDQQ